MPKKTKPFDLQKLKDKIDEVRAKARETLAQRGPGATFKERAKAEEALRTTSHIQARRGFKDRPDPSKPLKPKGDKTPKPKGKTVHEKRREPFEKGTGTGKVKRALEGVEELSRLGRKKG